MPEEPDTSQQYASGSYIAQATGEGQASITVQTIQRAPPSLDEQNRARFLLRLRTRYRDVLSSSLHGAVRMTLELAGHPDAVAPPLGQLSSEEDQHTAPPLLPTGTSLLQFYEEAGHDLLLLGEPGAGKSTLLLELAFALVEQAEHDQTLVLPVIVPLSSWGERHPPFEEWLSAHVALLYDIPSSLAAHWIQTNCFALLLDGLDEMAEEARPACITAINAYHQAHLHPLVVASRKREYEVAATHMRLELNQGVIVQPLTHPEVHAYLQQCGDSVAGLRTALQQNPVLQELATTPLLLSILILTYQGKAVDQLPTIATLPEQQRQIWADDVKRMLARKAQMTRTSPADLTRWLTFLAQQMREHHRTIFYLEHLQPDWLAPRQRHHYLWMGVRLPAFLIGVLLSLTMTPWFFPAPKKEGLTFSSIALLGGVLGALLSVRRTLQPSRHQVTRTTYRGQQVLVRTVTTGGVLGLGFGLSYHLTAFPAELGPISWLAVGLIFGLCGCGLALCLPLFTNVSRSPPQSEKKPWLPGSPRFVRPIQQGLVMGGLIGASYGLSFSFPSYWIRGILWWLTTSLFFGLVGGLLSSLLNSPPTIEPTEQMVWSWHALQSSLFSKRHLTHAAAIALLISTFLVLSYWPQFALGGSGLFSGLLLGLRYGLPPGLALGGTYWMLLGLFQGVTSEMISDQDRSTPNEGIHRSALHGLQFGCGGGLICSLVIMLYFAILTLPHRFWSADLQLGIAIGVFSVPLLTLLAGGLAVLRHLTIRLLLAHSHAFPWRAPRFLEEATARILLRRVGGGYSFPHRLLLDYFADVPDLHQDHTSPPSPPD